MPRLQTYQYKNNEGGTLSFHFEDDNPNIDKQKVAFLGLLKEAVQELTTELGKKIIPNK